MIDVTAIGELLIDFACKDTDAAGFPVMKGNPGGAPGNLLAALTEYGCKTALLAKVGDDAFGQLLNNTLSAAGIETSGIIIDSEVFTTLAFVTFDETGNRHFSFARKPGADTRLRYDELNLKLIEECRDFHFGTLSLTDEPARSATIKAIAHAKAYNKIVSFDPNLRKPLWSDLEAAKDAILWGLKQADIVKVSDEETDFLWGCTPPEAAKILHDEFGVTLAFITLGSKGCYYSGNGYSGYIKSPKVNPIDTTGAGDIFGGSVLSRILQSGKSIDALAGEELEAATKFACYAASLSTQNLGGISGICPIEEVEAELAHRD